MRIVIWYIRYYMHTHIAAHPPPSPPPPPIRIYTISSGTHTVEHTRAKHVNEVYSTARARQGKRFTFKLYVSDRICALFISAAFPPNVRALPARKYFNSKYTNANKFCLKFWLLHTRLT